ncbi:dihydroorotase [candidate division KSB1 bacterium]|nr:dihydroorotase [candidate division KSB1 bacterium]NIR68458.1 dihydroorotase [candidate division KSB1 bacterium]NIS25109.1 dihydroorotase [candidate division KSB1 bacterium]NIT72021.1 dihydroorotase [candidate division KSB1 bacterium]NIU25808.1 dihydroorotase [candidate division KSB1 bacterium]
MSLTKIAQPLDNVLFKNGIVVDPEKLTQEPADVLVENGKLKRIGKIDVSNFNGELIDLQGQVLCPGLIDMHVHLREPGREDEETVETGTDAAMMGGFTAVCPMPNTDPPADNAEVVRFLKERSEELLVEVFPIAAVTKQRAGAELTEMAELVKAGAVAFSDDGDPVATSEILRRAMEYARMFDVPIIEHCEDKSLTIDGAMHEGAVSTRLGLPGIPAISEEIIVARDILVAEFTKARLHIAHISTVGAVELVRQAKERGISVTCEVTPHHFTLNHEAVVNYDTNTKMNPPLRSQKDVEAMLEGLRDGTIDVIATDHAPHAIEEKETEYEAAPFGIIGLETALGLILTKLVEADVLTLPQAICKITKNPAKILNLERGVFKVGSPASLTVFDPKPEWTVDKKQFKSRSKNSPFHGWKLKGKVFGLYNQGLWWPNQR